MSDYAETAVGKSRLLRLLDVVWRTSPRVKSDAARFYTGEVAQAACLGLITTKEAKGWSVFWHMTRKGMDELEKSRTTTR